MNREAIQKVRDVIAGLPAERFGMEYLYNGEPDDCDGSREPLGKILASCGTVACIAGWALATLEPDEPAWSSGSVPLARARNLFGLTDAAGYALFCPPNYGDEGRYTLPHAVRVLDHLLATGEVDWKTTRRAKKAAS